MKYLYKYNEAKKLRGEDLDIKCRELHTQIKTMLNLDINGFADDIKNILFDVLDEYNIEYDWKELLKDTTIRVYPTNFAMEKIVDRDDDSDDIRYYDFRDRYEDNIQNVDEDGWEDDPEDIKKEFYKEVSKLFNQIVSPKSKLMILNFSFGVDIPKSIELNAFEFNSVNSSLTQTNHHRYGKIKIDRNKLGKLENDIIDISPRFKSIGCEFGVESYISERDDDSNSLSFGFYFTIDPSKESKDWLNIIPEEKRKPLLDFFKREGIKAAKAKELIDIIYK